MNPEQIYGPLRAVVPLITSALVGWGMNDNIAGLLAGGLMMVVAAVWSYFSNRPAALADQIRDVAPAVKIEVGPTAPPELKAMARDPNITHVVARP